MTISISIKHLSSSTSRRCAVALVLTGAISAAACLDPEAQPVDEPEAQPTATAAREGARLPWLHKGSSSADAGDRDARRPPPLDGTPLPSLAGGASSISAGVETITTYFDDAAHSNVVGECEYRTCPPKGRTCWGTQTLFKTTVSMPCQ